MMIDSLADDHGLCVSAAVKQVILDGIDEASDVKGVLQSYIIRLVGGLEHVLFSHRLGIFIPID